MPTFKHPDARAEGGVAFAANSGERVIFHRDHILHDMEKDVLTGRADLSEQLTCPKKGQMDIRLEISTELKNGFKKFAGRDIASQQIYANMADIILPSQGSPHGQHKIRNEDRFCVQCAA